MQKYQNLLWKIEEECEKWKLAKRFAFDLEKMVEESGFYANGKSKILTGFWIEENVGNNSFVFEKGKKVFVPELRIASSHEPRATSDRTKIVFRDQNEKGNLIESVGLENFILTQGEKTGIPIYIVDNHNWAFYCWNEFQSITNYQLRIRNCFFQTPSRGQGGVSPKESHKPPSPLFKGEQNILIHLDAHKDEAESDFRGDLEKMNLVEIREETVKLKVSNYIKAGIQGGLIQSNFLSLTESKDFVDFDKKFKLLKTKSQNIILNVDLDIFAPEVSLISLEDKVKAIGYFATKADLITFATSPGFIDQELAIEIVKFFLDKL